MTGSPKPVTSATRRERVVKIANRPPAQIENGRHIPEFLRAVDTPAPAAPGTPAEAVRIETVPLLIDQRISWPALLQALVQAGFAIQNDGHGNLFVTDQHQEKPQ